MKTTHAIRFHYGTPPTVKQEIGGETMTQQHMAAETDINNIMKRYERDGIIEHFNQYQGEYGDFTVMPDFHTAMNTIREADEMFLSLPASIRDRFDNDPAKFVDFATDKNNLAEMREMGLARKADGTPPQPRDGQPPAVDKSAPKEPKKADKSADVPASS